jgi:3-oxoacyl-[acyl-carrier protein] reductase
MQPGESFMENNIAIVTGGVTGIGNAVAQALSSDGYHVVVCDVDVQRGKDLDSQGASFSFQVCDVGDEQQVRDLVHGVRDRYGRIDVLVNNAGIIRRRTGETISVSDWDDVFAVNARGAFLFCTYVAGVMRSQQSGRIVNISSIAGKLGDITSAPGYGPSKAAMDALTKTFARELAPFGITVNGVAPHAIQTEMSAEWSDEKRREVIASIPLKRLGEPHEVAAAVRFLVSESAGFITGEIIDVNGGTIMD